LGAFSAKVQKDVQQQQQEAKEASDHFERRKASVCAASYAAQGRHCNAVWAVLFCGRQGMFVLCV
jgi:hypothetical protein